MNENVGNIVVIVGMLMLIAGVCWAAIWLPGRKERKEAREKRKLEGMFPTPPGKIATPPENVKPRIQVKKEGVKELGDAMDVAAIAAGEFGKSLNDTMQAQDEATEEVETVEACRPLDKPDLPEVVEDDHQQQEASSHLGYDAQEINPVDKPDVVTITNPIKLSQREALKAGNDNRAATGQAHAELTAMDLREEALSQDEVAALHGYANRDSMRRALKRYGYGLDGKKKAQAQEAS